MKKASIIIALATSTIFAQDANELLTKKQWNAEDFKAAIEVTDARSLVNSDLEKVLENAEVNQSSTSLGAGSTGGGQGTNGFLRDLQGPSFDCIANLEAFSKDYPTFQKLNGLIASANLGFAHELKMEMKKARVCMVDAPLNQNVLSDQDGLIISNTDYDQLAIRAIYPIEDQYTYGVDIYINKSQFEQMQNEEQRSFLLMHELMHSFTRALPAVSYINRLRSSIASMYQAFNDGQLSTQELNDMAYNYGLKYKRPVEYANQMVEDLKIKFTSRKLVYLKGLLQQIHSNQKDFVKLRNTLIYASDSFNDNRQTEMKEILKLMVVSGLDLSFNEEIDSTLADLVKYKSANALTSFLNSNLNHIAAYVISQNTGLEINQSFAAHLMDRYLKRTRYGSSTSMPINAETVVFVFKSMSKKDQSDIAKSLKKFGKTTARKKEIKAILKERNLI